MGLYILFFHFLLLYLKTQQSNFKYFQENLFVYLDLNKHILQSSGYKIEAGDFRYGSTLLFLILYLDVLTNSLIYELGTKYLFTADMTWV